MTVGVFPSARCTCGAVGVPPSQPYCDDCLRRLPGAHGAVLGGEAA